MDGEIIDLEDLNRAPHCDYEAGELSIMLDHIYCSDSDLYRKANEYLEGYRTFMRDESRRWFQHNRPNVPLDESTVSDLSEASDSSEFIYPTRLMSMNPSPALRIYRPLMETPTPIRSLPVASAEDPIPIVDSTDLTPGLVGISINGPHVTAASGFGRNRRVMSERGPSLMLGLELDR